jgi:regulator of protease activity HflC (stomatin/prohibitin superfamily)
MARPKLKTVVRWVAGTVLGVLVFGGCAISRTRWIPAGYVGLIYDATSGLQSKVYKPQAIFVGFRQQLYIYPTRLQNALYTQDPSAGEIRSADGILITTDDNANTTFDVSVIYRVLPENVQQVFNEFGAIPIEDIQSMHIRRVVKEAANVVGTQYDLFALMGPKRQEASAKLTVELQNRLGRKGITIERAMLGGCYPTPEFQQKITSRVNAYIELEISRLRQQIAEIDRQVARVKNEADSQAQTLSAATTKDRSIELLKLEAQKAAIDKWNGSLPPISPRPGQTIVITPEAISRLGGGR